MLPNLGPEVTFTSVYPGVIAGIGRMMKRRNPHWNLWNISDDLA